MSCMTPRVMQGSGSRVRPTSGPRSFVPEREGRVFEVPCNRCVGCRLDVGRMWSIRIQHEAQLYDTSLFLTLTYDDSKQDYVGPSLEYRDVQLFLKRLRDKYRYKGVSPGPKGNFPLRFFVAGEYGGLTGRPHWHMVLFNMWFKDSRLWSNGDYYSEDLECLWKLGNCTLGSVTPGRASYVAGYVNKKAQPNSARYERMNWYTGELVSVRPEFHEQSSNPGIGYWWYEKYSRDVFPNDFAVSDGKRWKPPVYYWRKFKEMAPEPVVEEIMHDRMERARERRSESTPERRAVREEVAEAKLRFYSDRRL